MKHLIKGRRLNRSPTHREALKRNLAAQLFAHERIITTVAKAKELRPFAERLITIARKAPAQGDESGKVASLAVRRRLIQALGGKKFVEVKNERINVIDKLINDIGPRFRVRPGGYTRIIKRAQRRLGDAGETAFIEMLPAHEGTGDKA
ncbi:MAG: 50S ribosomal protein L17 [Planctomycetota bacterium]